MEIQFLRQIIGWDGIKPNRSKIDCVQKWPVPQSTKDICHFFGLVCYFDSFLPQLAQHAEVLNHLTRKDCDKQFPKWAPYHQHAFDSIKDFVVSMDCLTTIDHNNPRDNYIYVTCDASKINTSMVLFFGPSWELAQPMAFDSKSLKGPKLHYPTHKKEMLAIVCALCKWQMICR
ncbi:hypothetical protein H1R20_g11765, partial [Candolleomyces eurysporus]